MIDVFKLTLGSNVLYNGKKCEVRMITENRLELYTDGTYNVVSVLPDDVFPITAQIPDHLQPIYFGTGYIHELQAIHAINFPELNPLEL